MDTIISMSGSSSCSTGSGSNDCSYLYEYQTTPEFYTMWFNIFMIIFTVFFIGWKVIILVFKKM